MSQADKRLPKRVELLEKRVDGLAEALGKLNTEPAKGHKNDEAAREEMRPGRAVSPHRARNEIERPKPKNGWEIFRKCKDVIEVAGIVAAIGVVLITYFQWKDLSHNFFVQERPYVFAVVSRPNWDILEEGKPTQWRVHYSNFGHSPAVEVQFAAEIFYGPRALDRVDDLFRRLNRLSPLTHNRWIMPPNAAPFVQAGVEPSETDTESRSDEKWKGAKFVAQQVTDLSSWSRLSQSDIDYIYKTNAGLIVAGRIQYEDIAGHAYSTDFCHMTLATGSVASCRIHNVIR